MVLGNPAEFIRKLRSLSAVERGFAARAWLLAPAVEASLAAVGVRGTLRWLDAAFAPADANAAAPDPTRAEQLVNAAYRRHVLRGQCLPRALTQYALLRRAGRDVRFVIGVNTDEGLRAHAWVQIGGNDDTPSAHGDVTFERLMVAGS